MTQAGDPGDGTADERAVFTVPPLVRFADYALEQLGAAREEIDALNVYPVPDGDTGTNLFLTVEAAREALEAAIEEHGGEDRTDLRLAVASYARGLLLGARGNSGVILAQLVGALFRRIGRAGPQDRAAQVLADGMAAAAEAGYAAVGTPVEGTMLTVARAAAQAAQRRVEDAQARTADVLAAAAGAAAVALEQTTDQLAVLRQAGVVDAGARGLCLVLEAAEAAFTGRREVAHRGVRVRRPVPPRAADLLPTGDLTEGGPAYEVMYLLDAPDDRIPALREALFPLGDSLVVVGGEGLWNVHVHVHDVGAALEAGLAAGRPHRVRVTHFAEQLARAREGRAPAPARDGRAVVVVCRAPGLAAVLREAGAQVLLTDGRPATGELLEAVRASGAAEVVLLPDDRDVVPTAEAAARVAADELGLRVAVVPTVADVQGMAALAVHEPARSFDEDLVEMTAAARHARTGGVTVAARRAMTSAGPCEPGDVLGAVEGDFVIVGGDVFAVGVSVLERLLGGGGELVTVLAGAGARDVADACAEHVRHAHPSVEVDVYDGGHATHPLLFGVE